MTADELLARLHAHYGAAFAAAQPSTNPQAVWQEWNRTLSALSPALVAQALAHLPQQPPTPVGFQAIAVMNRDSRTTRTDAPKRKAMDELHALRDDFKGWRDPLAWAKKLRQRERNGERLTPTIARFWREVLHENDDSE